MPRPTSRPERPPARQLALPGLGAAPVAGRPAAVLEQRGGVEFSELPVRSVLSRASRGHLSDVWSLNPYRGCEFGCVFCYARYTHEYLDLHDPLAFERRVFVKLDGARALRRDLASGRDVRGMGLTVGTAADPWQPAEARYGLTRALLRELLPHRGLRLSMLTRSALVARDAALLAELSQRHRVTVCFSLTTLDEPLQRLLEPRAPPPAVRLRALRQLAQAGVRCELLLMPLLPGLTDGDQSLRAVARAAREAGAAAAHAGVVRLCGLSRARFLPWLDQHFGRLAPRYRSEFTAAGGNAPPALRTELEERAAAALAAAGFPSG